ncbi:MAG TPA: Uma2 family endonuclease [Longimicrobium sp.]|jgi:Uma2 family endonuclease
MVDLAIRHRFTVDEFHRMGEAGILSEDDRVELINGEIVEMTPIGSRHASCVRRLDRWLQRLVGDEALVSAQQPLTLSNDGELIPDVALLRPRSDDYSDSHPMGSDALLVIEVADSSVLFDRNAKSRLYAEGGVPEYWVADLTRNSVAVFRDPENGQYTEERDHRRGESWVSPALRGRTISVDDVLAAR